MKIRNDQTIRPLHDLLLVKLHEKVQEKGRIILASSVKIQDMTEGVVLAVGPGRYQKDGWFRITTIKIGHIVLWGKFSGMKIEVNGEKCALIEEEKILGVFSRECYGE